MLIQVILIAVNAFFAAAEIAVVVPETLVAETVAVAPLVVVAAAEAVRRERRKGILS